MAIFGRKPLDASVRGASDGIPGVERSEAVSDELTAMLLTRAEGLQVIGEKEIREAAATLKKYKDGKINLERRVVEDELWWELRHWETRRTGRKRSAAPSPEPNSAWLFNAILNKHADAMDNYPEPVVLPRERSDEQSAKTLTQVLPVLMEYNDFEKVYSDNWWEKLKHGTACYGVFWNRDKENGLGDVDIRGIDLLKLFWEPGVNDVQKSRNLFIVDLVDNDLLEAEYGDKLKGKKPGNAVDLKEYIYDDTVDTSEKSVVVDWYYKVRAANGRTILHYVKFVGDVLLYASENDPEYRERGFYDHGLYPVVFDTLFPEKGTPVGFGYVAICKDPQLYIDKLFGNILETSMLATKKRFFVSSSTNINREQFLDATQPIVDVEGELDERRIQEIVTQPLPSIYVDVARMKIEEMKDTAANRDVNSGGSAAGVTAAAAIAALQEAGSKASRDMIAASYRAYTDICKLAVELVRQFYDVSRSFRITLPGASTEFVTVSSDTLGDQMVGVDSMGNELYRRPVFDLKIKAQKKNPFSRMEQNERAKELYALGFFNPERAQEALGALEMMSFEGIDGVREQVQQGQTLFHMCRQLRQENLMLKAAMGAPLSAASEGGGAARANMGAAKSENALARGVMEAQTPMTGYGEALAKRSTPSLE